MTAITNTFEGGSNGTTVTTGNSGGSSGTAFDEVTIGGASTLTYSNTHVANGAMGVRILTASGAAAFVEHNTALGTQTSVWGRFYLYLAAIPTKTTVLARLRTGTTGAAYLRLKTSAKIELLDTASAPQNTSTTVLSAATLYRIEWRVVCSTTVGFIECKIFDSPQSTTPIETFATPVSINTQASVDEYSVGVTNSPASVVDMYVDEIEWNNTGYPGPSSTGSAVTPALQSLAITRPTPTVTQAGVGSFTGWTFNPIQPWASGGATALAVDPIVPGRLWISEDVGGLRRSDDYGATWHMYQPGIYDEETRRKCATVITALDPNRSGHSLTVAGFGNNNSGGTAEFEDDDSQWRRLNTGVRFNSQNDTITAGLSGGKPRTNKKLITVSSDGFIYSAEYGTNQIKRKPAGSGTTWTVIAANVGATIRSIAVDPDDPSRLYFGVYSEGGGTYGLNLITDPADTPSSPSRLTPTRAAGGPETVEMITFAGGIIYLACGDDGVWRSGSGSASSGTLLVTPTQTAKLGSSWFVNNPDARKYAGRIENEAMCLAGGYYYVGTLGADLARTVAAVDLTGRNGLFRINATTLELDTSFNPAFTPDASTDGVSGTGLEIHAVTTNGTDVVVGGNFTTVEGQTRAGICAFDAVTGVLTSKFAGFTLTGGSATIYSAHFDPSALTTLYVGGSFTSVNGTARNRAAALTYSSLAVTSFNPNCSATVRVIKPWHSGATTRVAICMDPQGTIGNGGGTSEYSVASVSSAGAFVWGKNPSVLATGEGGGGYVMDVTDYVGSGGPYLVHGCVGQIDTGGNTAYLYDWTGTQLWFSGSNGDVQACCFYQGGKSAPVVMLGFHDNTVCTINSTSIPGSANALGFWSVSLAGVIDTSTFRPSFGQDTTVSGSAASYGGGTLKVWGLYADETNNRLLVGGDFTQVKTQVTGGTTISPQPRRLAIYNEASTTPSGWESINTGLPTANRYVMSLGVRVTGANHTLILGLHAPFANRSLWRSLNANAATAGAVSWSGIADSAIDNNYDSGVDNYDATVATGGSAGSAGTSIFAVEPDPHSTAGPTARWYMMTGPGSWFYVSNDNGATWSMSVEGLTIASHNWVSVASDGRLLFGDQDHDQFGSTDWGTTVFRMEPANTAQVTIGNVTYGPDYLDGWWGVDNPDDTTSNGYMTSGGEPSTQAAFYTGTGGESIQALVVGQVSGARRLVAYRNGKGVFRTAMPSTVSPPNWQICTGTPTNLLSLPYTTPNVPMVWPDPTGSDNIYWFLRAGTGSGGGVWMSDDAGVTCSRIVSNGGGGTRRGYVAASNDSPNVVYYTTDDGALRRVRNPGAGGQATDVIGGVDNAAAIWFDIDDNLLVYCLPTASLRPKLLRAEAPVPTTGSITFLDVLDPTVVGGAVDSSGQDSLLNVNSLNGDSEHIFVVINGASALLGTQVTSGNATVTPSLRTLTLTPNVPAVVGVDPSQLVTAQRQSLTISGTAPVVGMAVAPALQSMTLTLSTPGLINATAVSATRQSLTISPIQPASIASQNVAVPVVSLTIVPFVPAVSGGGGSRPVWMAFGAGSDEWYYERGNLT